MGELGFFFFFCGVPSNLTALIFRLSKLLPVGKHFKSGKAVGTPVFTAPEVLLGEPFDHSADVFSMGMSLFVFVARTPPKLPDDRAYESKEAFISSVTPPRNMRPVMVDFPSSVKKLVEWCWDPMAARRPSAAECVDRLEALMIESSIPDETGAAIWASVSDEKGVRESVSFETFFMSLVNVLSLKKAVGSQSALLLKELLGTMASDSCGDEVFLEDFGRLCALMGPVTKDILKRVKRMTKLTWFWGGTATKQAEKVLLARGDGHFLVRFSSQGANFALSYVRDGKIWHTRIKHTAGGERFELDGTMQAFGSLEALMGSLIRNRYQKILTACPGNPFEALWQRRKNSVGGYTE